MNYCKNTKYENSDFEKLQLSWKNRNKENLKIWIYENPKFAKF